MKWYLEYTRKCWSYICTGFIIFQSNEFKFECSLDHIYTAMLQIFYKLLSNNSDFSSCTFFVGQAHI